MNDLNEDSFSESDISELRKITQQAVQEDNRRKIEDRFGRANLAYLEKFGEELRLIGVYYDFDIAHHQVLFTTPRHTRIDTMGFKDLIFWCNEVENPIALAAAVLAGLVDPKHLNFGIWMMTINLLITNGGSSEWREVDATSIVVIDLSQYENSRDLTDIIISNEGQPLQNDNVRFVYDKPDTTTLPHRRRPWEFG